MIRDLFKDESGASAVEYSLLLGLIAMIVMGAITVLLVNHSQPCSAISPRQWQTPRVPDPGTGSYQRRAIAMETSILLQLLAVTVLIGLASTYIKRII